METTINVTYVASDHDPIVALLLFHEIGNQLRILLDGMDMVFAENISMGSILLRSDH